MVLSSLHALKFRGFAVSARSENAGVTGSTPVLSTILRSAERSDAQAKDALRSSTPKESVGGPPPSYGWQATSTPRLPCSSGKVSYAKGKQSKELESSASPGEESKCGERGSNPLGDRVEPLPFPRRPEVSEIVANDRIKH
jgi:hypothetical protein